MPRVLFVHHRPQLGGAVTSLSLLASALDNRWETHAVVPEGPAAELLRRSGVTVHPSPVPVFTHTWDVQYYGLRWLVLGRELVSAPAHVAAMRKALREIQPSVVHINDSVMLSSGALASQAGVPVVWHLRSALAHGGLDRRSRWICGQLDRWGSAAIAIDEDVSTTFDLKIPVHLIANPVDVQPGPAAVLDVPADRIKIGSFGYLRRQKGWPEILQALRILVDRGIGAHAIFVGGGIRSPEAFAGVRGAALRAVGVPNEERDFRRLVRRLDLAGFVTLVPFVSDPAPYLRSADIVVFPNQGVGLGRPVLEALALGKPVVASGSRPKSGLILDGETGVLLREGTPSALADALTSLIGDPLLRARLGAAAAKKAALSSPTAIASDVAALWDEVAAGTPERLPSTR
jgi:glycosyltransferase involved in cell wall biosynthesis